MLKRIISLLIIIAISLSLSGCLFRLPDIVPSDPSSDSEGKEDGGDNESGEEEVGEEPNPDEPNPDEPVIPTPDGYTFPTVDGSDDVYAVSSSAEAASVIDRAIAAHVAKVRIDFSALGEDYDPLEDFECMREFSSHVWLKYTQSESTPHILTVTLYYRMESASQSLAPTEKNTYHQITNANEVINALALPLDKRRSDDFSDFPIDLAELPEFEVYNSEELWWAVEHGYKPTFPLENSVAEEIYEKARAVLREIICEGMSEFDKALAIYEYIIRAVDYDYDSVNDETIPTRNNTCYYLEGVFNYGRAVCDGKSKAFVLLCGIEGISAVREFGYGYETETGHAWNYVRIDGVWYLVDTTTGDSASALSPDGVSSFYEKNVQIVKYRYFLTELDLYAEKYSTSGLWADILASNSGDVRSDEVLNGRYADFTVDRVSELTALMKAITDTGAEEFTLVIGISNMVSLFYGSGVSYSIMDDALRDLGLFDDYEYLAWVENLDSNRNCMYTFKLKK